jgi:hypothetical protein
VFLAELFSEFGGDTDKGFSNIGGYKWIIFFFGCSIAGHFDCHIAPPLVIIIGAKCLLHDVEVLMRCNCGRGVVLFSPIGGKHSA